MEQLQNQRREVDYQSIDYSYKFEKENSRYSKESRGFERRKNERFEGRTSNEQSYNKYMPRSTENPIQVKIQCSDSTMRKTQGIT